MFQRLAVRDTLLIILSVSAWMQLAPLGDASAAAGWTAGLALALVAYVAHEWGHALAAMAARSAIYPPRTLLHVSLFSFDARANSVRQFMLMSLGGFAVTGVAVLMAWWPAIASAGWVAGQLQRAMTGIEPPSIGHSTLEQMVQGTRDAWWWLMGLSAVVLAPVLEECLYRGFVQQALRRAGLGPWPAVLLASIVFTLMHVGSVPEGARAASLTSLAVLSCCFGWLAERTGSLVAPVAAHVAFNLGNLVVATSFA